MASSTSTTHNLGDEPVIRELNKMMKEYIGRYKLLERLGSGGQGTVYKAMDLDLDRIVAIKTFDNLIPMSEQDIESVRREARIAATLSNPNVATVYEFDIADDIPFMVMEYVPNSLDRNLKENRNIDLQETLRILMEICSAIGSAHESGIVHRDIKPPNILLTDEGSVKVVDFGLARLV